MPKINFFNEGSPYLNHPLLTAERTAKEIDFILSQIDIPPGGRILDVGCGPGRHSIELASRGFQVIGIDPSITMVQAARKRAEQAGISPTFHQDYGENFVSEKKFAAVLCLFTTLGQINDHREDNTQLVQNSGTNLDHSGYFILEIPNQDWIIRNLKAFERFDEGRNYTEIFRDYSTESNIMAERFNLRDIRGTRSYYLKYRVYNLNEIKTMLADSDFSILAIFGGYSEKPLSPDDPSIVLIAQR